MAKAVFKFKNKALHTELVSELVDVLENKYHIQESRFINELKSIHADNETAIDLESDYGCLENEAIQITALCTALLGSLDKSLCESSKGLRDEVYALSMKLGLLRVCQELKKVEYERIYSSLSHELQNLRESVVNLVETGATGVEEFKEKREALKEKWVQVEAALKSLQDLGREIHVNDSKEISHNNLQKGLYYASRERDKLEVELQSIRYMCDQTYLEKKNLGKSLAYNLIVAGVTGTGKSSSLNTLLDRQVCHVSGAQAQGTRGCNMQDGSISDEHFVSFIDTQGLGADTSITDTELLRQIMSSTESVYRMGIINNILISFDLANRQTPAAMANQLTLIELFAEVRTSCFLILTKWNTNSVQAEWNAPLRKWMKKWRRAERVADITEDPPSYDEMYQAYCNYIVSSMNNEEDGGSFSKMGTFLAFFESRVLWMYNLDGIQIEDKEEGEIEPHILKLYEFYRNKALDTLYRGRKSINVETITFLKRDEMSLGAIARSLIEMREEKIKHLESVGAEPKKLSRMEKLFKEMANQNAIRIKEASYNPDRKSYIEEIADIAGMKIQTGVEQTSIGCIIS